MMSYSTRSSEKKLHSFRKYCTSRIRGSLFTLVSASLAFLRCGFGLQAKPAVLTAQRSSKCLEVT